MTRSILICQREESSLTTSLSSQKTPAPQQDQASIESELLIPQELTFFATIRNSSINPGTSGRAHAIDINHRHCSVNETPVHPVEPVLGMTLSENC